MNKEEIKELSFKFNEIDLPDGVVIERNQGTNELNSFIKKMNEHCTDIDEEIQEIINERFWDMI